MNQAVTPTHDDTRVEIEITVSIIIPSYNRANTVGQTIESILNQKCDFPIEIIIGDDCSTDNAREILQSYKDKYSDIIKLIFHESNIGLGANWATCVKECQGKYIANCDNDDYWHNPNKLQLQVDFMEKNTNCGVCHTDYRKHNRNIGGITEHKCSNNTTQHNTTQQHSIMSGNFDCCNATVMYRASDLNKYINLDDYISMKFYLQDWNTWMILAKYTEFCCLHVSTATFGIETESITRPHEVDKLAVRFAKERYCYKYICDLFPNDFPYRESDYDVYENKVLLNLAYKIGDFVNAQKYASKLGNKSFKVLCAKYKPLFFLYYTLKNCLK